MNLKITTELISSKLIVKGWHISKHVDGPIAEIGTDQGKGYLLVTALKTTSTTAFGETWDATEGFTKKLWLSSDSVRGLDGVAGLIKVDGFTPGIDAIQISSSINEGVTPFESSFSIIINPDEDAGARRFGLSVVTQNNVVGNTITKIEDEVVNYSFVVRNGYGNPKLLAQEFTGYVEFEDAMFFVDASNIFPADPVEGEKQIVYVDSSELPVDMDVFARNFEKFEVTGGSIIQLVGSSLDGRSILANAIDNTKPLSLKRANTVNMFKNI